MKRVVCAVVAAACLAGCGRMPVSGLVTAGEIVQAVDDGLDGETSPELPADVSEVVDVVADATVVVDELCAAENASLPNAGDPCPVEGASACGKEKAFAKPTDWKPKSGPNAPWWAAELPDKTCLRPQILRCRKGEDGALTWVAEWCLHLFVPKDWPNQAPEKGGVFCQATFGTASCCNPLAGIKDSSGISKTIYKCDPKHTNVETCEHGRCAAIKHHPNVGPDTKFGFHVPTPTDFYQCTYWTGAIACPGPECLVVNTDPKQDTGFTCKQFPGKCIQLDKTSTTCSTAGCEAASGSTGMRGHCAGMVQDVQVWGADAKP